MLLRVSAISVLLGGALVAAYPSAPSTAVLKAVAKIQPLQNAQVTGTVTFQTKDDGVYIVADVDGLSPGKHGFHIHEKGDCSAPDGSSAGDHFNPNGSKHGAPWDKERHAGDLGNLVADDKGHAHYEWHDKLITLKGPDSIIGRSVIIHEKEDDLITQPTGNAGRRLGCGVIAPEY